MLADRPGERPVLASAICARMPAMDFEAPACSTDSRATTAPRASGCSSGSPARATRSRSCRPRSTRTGSRCCWSSACSAAATPAQRARASEPGCRPSQMLRIRRLLGLPEPAPERPRVRRGGGRGGASRSSLFLDAGLGEESIAEITRVLGEGMARLAATTAAAFVEAFLRARRQRGRGRRAVRRARRAADPGDRPGAGRGLQAAPRRERPARDARPRRARGRRGRRRSGGHGVLRRHGRVHAARSRDRGPGARQPRRASWPSSPPTSPSRRCGWSRRSATPRCSSAPTPAALVSVALSLLEAVEAAELPSLRAGVALRAGAAARRRLLRPRGQPGQPGDRRRPPRQRPVHRGGARRRRRPVRLVVRAQAQAQGHVRAGPAVPRPRRRRRRPRARRTSAANAAKKRSKAGRRRTRASS